jgi:hypothetical protein
VTTRHERRRDIGPVSLPASSRDGRIQYLRSTGLTCEYHAHTPASAIAGIEHAIGMLEGRSKLDSSAVVFDSRALITQLTELSSW